MSIGTNGIRHVQCPEKWTIQWDNTKTDALKLFRKKKIGSFAADKWIQGK